MPNPIKLSPLTPPDGPKKTAAASVAPAAQVPPELLHLNGPPLNPGQVMKATSGMTRLEYNQLTEVGWQPGQPVTDQMRSAIASMQEDAAVGAATLPVDPGTQPVTLNVIDIGARAPQPAAQPAPGPVIPGLPPGQMFVQQDAAKSKVAEQINQSKQLPIELEAPVRPARRHTPEEELKPAETASPAGAASASTMAAKPQSNCPHCGWDLARDDIPEPDAEEKLSFLSTRVLGEGKPFVKVYDLFGGALHLTFRTLTTREIDVCYKQTNSDRKAGKFETDYDWIEYVNRYRLSLQLQRMKTATRDDELPDGLSKWHSPHAEVYWEDNEGYDREHPLLQIEDHMMTALLTTESLARVVQQTCARFNRLVSKLEAQAANSSFWSATAQPPSQPGQL